MFQKTPRERKVNQELSRNFPYEERIKTIVMYHLLPNWGSKESKDKVRMNERATSLSTASGEESPVTPGEKHFDSSKRKGSIRCRKTQVWNYSPGVIQVE